MDKHSNNDNNFFEMEENETEDDTEEVEFVECDDNEDDLNNDIEQLNDDDELDSMNEQVDEAVWKFDAHQEPVLCCDVTHDDKFVVTGGQDDKAFVWETSTQKILFEINGHKDSVDQAKFNRNASMVATADLGGIVQVFDLSGQKCFDFEVDEITWLHWHPVADNVLLAGTVTGDAWMWKLSHNNPQCKTIQSHGFATTSARMFKDGKRIVMGYENGHIKVWNLKDTEVNFVIKDHQAHNDVVTSLDLNEDDSLIASSSQDCTVKVINTNNGKVLMNIACGELDKEDSIEMVAFSGKNLLALATNNGTIQVWDVAGQVKRSELKLDDGFSKISIDRNNPNLLYCGGLDSHFRVLDLRTCEVLLTRSGHTDQILDFCISFDSKYALTCSDDATCRIFSLVDANNK